MATTFDVTVANMLPAALTKLRFIVLCVQIRRVYVYRCMYACMCVCVFICLDQAEVHCLVCSDKARICVYMYVCMYVRVCIHLYMYNACQRQPR